MRLEYFNFHKPIERVTLWLTGWICNRYIENFLLILWVMIIKIVEKKVVVDDEEANSWWDNWLG